MAKFKVGDKVRVKPYSSSFPYVGISKLTLQSLAGDVYTVKSHRDSDVTAQWYNMTDSPFSFAEEMLELAEQPRREFIVIRRDGAKTIAELRHDREVIKSGTAICNASDTFDFGTGAKLAFDRLMGRDEPQPEPPKYYTGKVVCISGEYGIGKVFTVRNGFFTDGDYNCPDKPYKSVDDMNSRFLFGKFAALKE